MTAIASMVGTTAKAIVNATPTTMVVGRMADVIVDSTVADSDRASSLVMAEVTVNTMFSMHGGRWQQHVNAGERCQETARAGPATAMKREAATATAFATATVMVTAMDLAWMTGMAAATLPAMATTQESK